MTTIPAESTRTIVDRVREAAARRTPLRIVGQGTWLDAGRAVNASEPLSTRELSGIVDYVPGDLTLTVRAGTTLAEVRDATAEHNQWLALDPHGTDTGTIGATIATASAGPLSTAFGLPRDLVLGLEFVSGAANVVRAGGRVVKNVAGFDLTRLITGSWGTLGVITEVTVRLHARPEADVTVGVTLSGSAEDLSRVRQFLRRIPFAPYACEVREDVALFRLGGNSQAVEAQHASLAELGQCAEMDASVWSELRAIEPEGAIVIRLSALPSDIASVWATAKEIASSCAGTRIHARPSRGMVRCIIPRTDDNVARLARLVGTISPFTCAPERLSAELWRLFPSAASDRLSTSIKRTFDPESVLNPGIHGEVR